MGALIPEERAAVRARSPIGGKYDTLVNRESAYEILTKQMAANKPEETKSAGGAGQKPPERQGSILGDILWGTKRRQGMAETMAKQAARTMGSQLGRQILRGILGGILGTTRWR